MVSWLRRRQRGEGRIGLIITIVVLVSAGYLIFKWVPVRTQNAEFTDFLERSCMKFAVGDLTEAQLTETVLEYAAKEEIPLGEKDLTIDFLADKVVVRAKYTVDIPLVGGKVWPQNYDVRAEARRF